MKKTVKENLEALANYCKRLRSQLHDNGDLAYLDRLISSADEALGEKSHIRYMVSSSPGSSMAPDGWSGYADRWKRKNDGENIEVYGYEQALEHVTELRTKSKGEYDAHWRNCILKIVSEETFYAEVSDHPGQPIVEVGSLEIGDIVRRQYNYSNFARYDWTITDITDAGDVLLMDEEGKTIAYHKTTPVLLMSKGDKGEKMTAPDIRK